MGEVRDNEGEGRKVECEQYSVASITQRQTEKQRDIQGQTDRETDIQTQS